MVRIHHSITTGEYLIARGLKGQECLFMCGSNPHHINSSGNAYQCS
uniref:Uncharacterized protein n=1 Tax=Bacteriophage sp. TaxID=38018 RepID=A0A8D9PGQ8_9VIRU|nr:MAG TPA: hypothetical protein [Bacteriophage sp.]DAE81333.1 MAG TPA: hypothetical protein [Bacteriophage sp.]DAU14621.1 MAG TPA: hypothetical protein [Caudoviricetes sp.]